MDTSPTSYARESSHKSNAVAPKRQRGRERVALILDAAGAVFAEKGVDGATMTEIAERSGTAIGSLYRFFPTKEGIALTLLERFIEDRLAKLDQIKAESRSGACDAAAGALLEAWLDKKTERDFTTHLLAARPDAEQFTSFWRSQFQERLVSILEVVMPSASVTASARAVVLLHVLKLAPQLVTTASDEPVRAELRKIVLGLVSGL